MQCASCNFQCAFGTKNCETIVQWSLSLQRYIDCNVLVLLGARAAGCFGEVDT